MSSYRVLITMPLAWDHIDEYRDRFAERGIEYDIPDTEGPLCESALRDEIDAYDGVITGFVGLDEETIEAATQLQVISQWGIGLDDIDIDAVEQQGISVYNTPGAFSEEIADVVIAYLVLLTRRLHVIDRAVRDGDWPAIRGTSLRDQTLGIVGVGDIGAAVARRGHAHGLDLLGTDIEPLDTELQRETGIERVPLEDLFTRADAVSLNCPLTPETRGLVGRDKLDCLGSEGYLINTARGEIVQQGELVDALQEGRIAGTALDVFETEPLPEDHPLTTMENVVLGSHNAGNTTAAVRRTTERAVDNLIAGLTDERDET